jgi:PilZ domain
MSSSAVQVERRVGQRFPFLLPVSFRDAETGMQGVGFTQDVSSRGVLFLTETPLHQGSRIQLTLDMPAEITLGESMRVRCDAQVLRVSRPVGTVPSGNPVSEGKLAVAARLDRYEYIADSLATSPLISSLHPQAPGAGRREGEGKGETT